MPNFPRFLLAATLLAAPVVAQTPAAPKAPGNLTFSGDLSSRAGGVRLDANARGPARVHLPQLDASARALALDLDGQTIRQVRALGNVNFKLDLAPQGGGAPTHIEATCDSATLTTRDRKLVLRGNLKGFYQIAGGAKTTLSGEGATIFYEGKNLVADLLGGASGGVSLRVPAETLGRPDDLGDILVTAQRARINQADGSATFAGNARAVSSGGANGSANAFDVSAARFVLTRSADGTISTLKTIGRTLVKLDLPPDAVAPGAAPNAGGSSVGKPTHVEVAADSATIDRATSTAIFEGNVKGFYHLDGAPQNYDFAGTKATIRYAPTPGAIGGNASALAKFELQVKDAEGTGPAFNLGF